MEGRERERKDGRRKGREEGRKMGMAGDSHNYSLLWSGLSGIIMVSRDDSDPEK